MPSKETQKYITWGLIASTVVFLILFIVFVSLFATKHEDSSAFLLTSKSTADVNTAQKEVKRILDKKFHVNSISTDEQLGIVTSVFSLRGKQSASSVQGQFNGNSVLSDATVTDGSSGYSVCHAHEPTNGIPTTVGTGTDEPVTTSTATTTTTTKKVLPPVQSFYCDNVPTFRDVIIVVDMLKDVDATKANSLATLGIKIAKRTQFQTTRLWVMGADGGGHIEVSKAFASTSQDFTADWNKMLAMAPGKGQSSLEIDNVFTYIESDTVRGQSLPGRSVEVVILTSHFFGDILPEHDLRSKGVFVAPVSATSLMIQETMKPVASTDIIQLNTWAEVATVDPLESLMCQFVYTDNSAVKPPAPALFSQDWESILATVDNTCEKVDIIFVFDTSQSVIPPYLNMFKTFAKSFATRFTLSGALDNDNVRVGIIQFSETAAVKMALQVTTQANFNQQVDSIFYTGGLTNTKAALDLTEAQFDTNGASTHGKFVVFMTDGVPTVGTLQDSINVGQQLSQKADIFFIGDDGYDATTKAQLAKINNNHTEWIYDTPNDASIQLPSTVLKLFPCPIPICELDYYAIEVSEATQGSGFLMESLLFVKTVANQVANMKPNAQFQMMLYNDKQHFLPDKGGSITQFNTILNNLQTNFTYLESFMSGHTRLDLALNTLATTIGQQQFLNRLFQSSVLIAGEANYFTLDPHCTTNDEQDCENQRKQQLRTAGTNLAITNTIIYAFDGSLKADPFGDDLWPWAVPTPNIVYETSAHPKDDLTAKGYFDQVHALSCVMPTLSTCNQYFIDVSVVLDVVGDDTKIKAYLTSFLAQFNTMYTTHVSMIAIGTAHPVTTLGGLGSYNSSSFTSEMFWEYERWRLGESIYTTGEPTTEAPETPAPKGEDDVGAMRCVDGMCPVNYLCENARCVKALDPVCIDGECPFGMKCENSRCVEAVATPMTAAVINDMFAALQGQYGCGHYDDFHDRTRAANIVFYVSDNFKNYDDALWNSFPTYISEYWSCEDCPGKPVFYFLSLTDDLPSHGLNHWSLKDTDYDLTQPASIYTMNRIINTVCTTPQPVCSIFTPATICQTVKPW